MKYTWSFYDDDYWYHGIFDSVEECLQDAKANKEPDDPDTIYIGEFEQYVPTIDTNSVLEDIAEYACEEYGEVSENWDIDYQSQEQIKDLDKKLNKVFIDWLKKYKLIPTFGKINNVEEYYLE